MKGGKAAGYTILEVMIVLAVSGVMFVIAASFINGRQARAAYTAGVTDIASAVQSVISQINDGQFTDIPLGCAVVAGAPVFTASGSQGTSEQCIFLGKVLQFRPDTGDRTYNTYSIAGAREDAVTRLSPITIAAAQPRAIHPRLTTNDRIAQGLEVEGMNAQLTGGGTANTYAFGLLQSLSEYDGTGALVSGTQGMKLYVINGVTSGMTPGGPGGAVARMNAAAAANYQEASKVTICVTDGTRHAQILIGAQGSSYIVETDLTKSTNEC